MIKQAARCVTFSLFALSLLSFSRSDAYAQEERAQALEIPGRIAIIGNDRNVYMHTPATDETITLTEDAAVSATAFRYYTWPTWSTDGRLAYFAIDNAEDEPITTQVYVSEDGLQVGEVIYNGELEVFNYASWAPGNCADSGNCRVLSILLNDATGGGLFVEVVKDQVEGNPSEVIGTGGPFYYSWSPDGDQMLWQRNNRRMDVYNVGKGDIDVRLPQSPGIFQAPDWSPVDNRLLFGAFDPDEQTTDLIIVDGDTETVLAEGLDGLISFAWSPDGEQIAYVEGGNPLTVIDAGTGAVVARTFDSGISSYFWSPDSSKLAYITLAAPRDGATAKGGLSMAPSRQDIQIVWSVLDVASEEISRYDAFTPTQDMIYMFRFFDQFAQSHSVWSPDSNYIVYGEVVDEGAVVSIQGVTATDTVPMIIADGTLGVWSYE